MNVRIMSAVLILAASVLACAADEPAYRLVDHFFQLPDGLELGPVAGVAVNAKGEIAVAHRGDRPVLIFDAAGRFIRSFGDGMFDMIHGTRWDPAGNLWITDAKNHTVVKFSPDGRVLMLLGERGTPGSDGKHFNRPTDVAFAPTGEFFVTDGYGNNRVAKFTADGTFIKDWGTPGNKKSTKPGEFHLPHAIQIDAAGLLYVGDRENDRVEVFDQDGKFLRTFGGFAPYGLCIAADQTLYVADGRACKVLHMTLDGKLLGHLGEKGQSPGAYFVMPHDVAIDAVGALYVAEVSGKRIQKFEPVK